MRYAVIWLAVAFGAGILIPDAAALSPPLVLAVAGSLLFAGIAIGRCWRHALWIALLMATFLLGGFRASVQPGFSDSLLRRVPVLQELTGTVTSYPDIALDRVSFELELESLPGKVQVYWNTDDPLQAVYYGDVVRIEGGGQLPEAFDGFDYPAYLAGQGIFALFYADALRVEMHGSSAMQRWLGVGDRIRQRILTRFREQLPSDIAALAQSLLLGDRSALDSATEDAFSNTGLMHLLAVSGLHLGIFLAAAWWILRWIGLRPRVAYPVIGLLVLTALWVVGPRVSLIRSGLLFAFLGLGSVLADFGWILRRWIQPLNGLAAAAIAVLALRPSAIYEAGFQLTFSATASILLAFHAEFGWAIRRSVAAQRESVLKRTLRAPGRLMVVAAAAQAGVLPILAWHFKAVHPYSIVLNLIAVPLAALALWTGLLAVFLAWCPFVQHLIMHLFGWMLEGLGRVVGMASRLPYSSIPVDPRLGIWLAGFVGFLLLFLVYASSSFTSNSTSIVSGSPPVGAPPLRRK